MVLTLLSMNLIQTMMALSIQARLIVDSMEYLTFLQHGEGEG
jgi:hypothetical protein